MPPNVNKPGANSFNPSKHALRRYKTQTGTKSRFSSTIAASREEFSFLGKVARR